MTQTGQHIIQELQDRREQARLGGGTSLVGLVRLLLPDKQVIIGR